jgi:hypothetical protein
MEVSDGYRYLSETPYARANLRDQSVHNNIKMDYE